MEQKISDILSKLEKTRGEYWNVPKSTGQLLNALVRLLEAEKVLEIGTSNGYSGIHLAQALAEKGGMLFTVESHQERYEEAENNFKDAGLTDFITQIKGHAPEVLGEINEKFDLVFLDATKIEYQSYFDAILPKLIKDGVIIADNCISHEEDLGEFLEGVEKDERVESTLIKVDNGLLLCVKL
ncbi:O-methyltransferase [Pseudomonadota bacterium]